MMNSMLKLAKGANSRGCCGSGQLKHMLQQAYTNESAVHGTGAAETVELRLDIWRIPEVLNNTNMVKWSSV